MSGSWVLTDNDGTVLTVSTTPMPGWTAVPTMAYAGDIVTGGVVTPQAPPVQDTALLQLQQLWDSAPPTLRGPLYHYYKSAQELWARGDKEAVVAMLESIVPPNTATAEDIATFQTAIQQMKQAMQS